MGQPTQSGGGGDISLQNNLWPKYYECELNNSHTQFFFLYYVNSIELKKNPTYVITDICIYQFGCKFLV